MKRTKEGGAILELNNGEFVEISKKEFEIGRIKRDLIRMGIFLIITIPEALLGGDMMLSLGVLLVMMGLRLKTGW